VETGPVRPEIALDVLLPDLAAVRDPGADEFAGRGQRHHDGAVGRRGRARSRPPLLVLHGAADGQFPEDLAVGDIEGDQVGLPALLAHREQLGARMDHAGEADAEPLGLPGEGRPAGRPLPEKPFVEGMSVAMRPPELAVFLAGGPRLGLGGLCEQFARAESQACEQRKRHE
jgi:hypothetical protein